MGAPPSRGAPPATHHRPLHLPRTPSSSDFAYDLDDQNSQVGNGASGRAPRPQNRHWALSASPPRKELNPARIAATHLSGFMMSVQPFAAKIPYMVSPGNQCVGYCSSARSCATHDVSHLPPSNSYFRHLSLHPAAKRTQHRAAATSLSSRRASKPSSCTRAPTAAPTLTSGTPSTAGSCTGWPSPGTWERAFARVCASARAEDAEVVGCARWVLQFTSTSPTSHSRLPHEAKRGRCRPRRSRRSSSGSPRISPPSTARRRRGCSRSRTRIGTTTRSTGCRPASRTRSTSAAWTPSGSGTGTRALSRVTGLQQSPLRAAATPRDLPRCPSPTHAHPLVRPLFPSAQLLPLPPHHERGPLAHDARGHGVRIGGQSDVHGPDVPGGHRHWRARQHRSKPRVVPRRLGGEQGSSPIVWGRVSSLPCACCFCARRPSWRNNSTSTWARGVGARRGSCLPLFCPPPPPPTPNPHPPLRRSTRSTRAAPTTVTESSRLSTRRRSRGAGSRRCPSRGRASHSTWTRSRSSSTSTVRAHCRRRNAAS